MFVIAKYHQLLRELGLDSIEGVKKFRGELIKDHKGRRDIQRISTRVGQQPFTFFLKRNWKPYRKDGLRTLVTRGEVWSQSRVEWENSLALQRAGLDVAEPIAFGEENGLLWERFSFVLTSAARGTCTMDDFLRTCRDAAERRAVFDALARDVRKMHDAGLASPDLFARHVFLEPGPVPRFCLIDMARLDQRRKLPPRLRARDLAALHVTAPLRFVTARERLRFLRVYEADRTLRQLILQRAGHLLLRRKFADFAATPEHVHT